MTFYRVIAGCASRVGRDGCCPMDPQSDDAALREKAREVVRAGRLPNRRPDRTWGGSGGGADCTICGTPVKSDELEFEIEFAGSRKGSVADTYHVHIRCFRAWEFERNNAGSPPPVSSAYPPRDKA